MSATHRLPQLRTIEWLGGALAAQDVEYWLFGGWAVDFHVGRVTRDHADIDLAVWERDLDKVKVLLELHGWTHAPEPGEDGYTGYERDGVRIELALLARDENGVVFTPLEQGRGTWPTGSFGDVEAQLDGVSARVVGLASLIEDKSGPRDDAAVTAKDRADVALLLAVGNPGQAFGRWP